MEETPSYNNLQVQYLSSDNLSSGRLMMQSTLAGSDFFVDAYVASGSGKQLLAGSMLRGAYADLGYKLRVGPGDLNFTVGYAQQQLSGGINEGYGSDVVLGLAWRQKLNEVWEYSLMYQHWNGTFTFPIAKVANDVDGVYGELKYHFWRKTYLSLAYQNAHTSGSGTESTWCLGVGYNF